MYDFNVVFMIRVKLGRWMLNLVYNVVDNDLCDKV